MYKIKGMIQGTAPLLFNRPPEDSLRDIDSGVSGGKKTKQARIDEAHQRLYRDGNGIYLPWWNLKQCLMAGCRKANLKVNKSGLASYVAAMVFSEHQLLFGKQEPDFIHECFGKIPPGPKGKGAIIRRPAFKSGWELPFELTILDESINEAQLRVGLETAGMMIGLGAWRPEYGRFIVSRWEVLK